jgi:predicted  nucleic acid-binding Zn-ribbon protein
MNCGKKYDLSEKKCPKRKCPECGGKMKIQYTEEELKEIQKQNDDMVAINTLLM